MCFNVSMYTQLSKHKKAYVRPIPRTSGMSHIYIYIYRPQRDLSIYHTIFSPTNVIRSRRAYIH